MFVQVRSVLSFLNHNVAFVLQSQKKKKMKKMNSVFKILRFFCSAHAHLFEEEKVEFGDVIRVDTVPLLDVA